MLGKFFRKEPEKPNFTGDQHEHKNCLIVFEGSKAADHLSEYRNKYAKTTVTMPKMTARLLAMITSCQELSGYHVRLQRASIVTIQIAKTFEEYVAMTMGIMPAGEIQGFTICPGCLQQSIIACEEVLNSLKDIQENTKEYV